MSDFEVRDRRRPGFFTVDNHVLDQYGKIVGVTAWAIYTTLCRLANEQRDESGTRRRRRRISVNGLATLWGISRATVKRATSTLRKQQLIRVTKKQGISEIELLNVEQLNFDDKLIFGGLTSEPSETKPDSSSMSPPKAQTRSLPRLTDEPHSKTSLSKTSLSKNDDVERGFKPAAVTSPRGVPSSSDFLAQVTTGLREILEIDSKGVQQIVSAWKESVPDCTPEEIVAFAWGKAPAIRKPNTKNPTGLLIHAMTACFDKKMLEDHRQRKSWEEQQEKAEQLQRQHEAEETRKHVERVKREDEELQRRIASLDQLPKKQFAELRAEAERAEWVPQYRGKMTTAVFEKQIRLQMAKLLVQPKRRKA